MSQLQNDHRRTGSPSFPPPVKSSPIEGLWVILTNEEDRKVPMMARAGSGLYLLAFKTGFTARKFMADSQLPADAEPRMVVVSSLPETLAYLASKEAAGFLVDYDPTTNAYKDAGVLA